MQDVTAQVDELCSALGHSLPREVVLQSLQGADFDSERALLALVELLPAVASHDTDSDALCILKSWQKHQMIGLKLWRWRCSLHKTIQMTMIAHFN